MIGKDNPDKRFNPAQRNEKQEEEFEKYIKSLEGKYIDEIKNRYVNSEGGMFLGVVFTTEEENLLVPIFNNKIKIINFYHKIIQIHKEGGINKKIEKYNNAINKKEIVESWTKTFTNKIIIPEEQVLFKNIIEKVEKRIQSDVNFREKIIELIEISQISTQSYSTSLSKINLERKESAFNNKIIQVLEKTLALSSNDDIAAIKDNKNNARNIFLKEFVRQFLSQSNSSNISSKELFIKGDELLSGVLNKIK